MRIYKKVKALEKTLEALMAPTKELAHGRDTKEWLLKLKPDAEWQIQIAALAHDIERAVEHIPGINPPKPNAQLHSSYDSYKQEHAKRSANIVSQIMKNLEFSADDTSRVSSAIQKHEVGGDDDSNLVRDADSIRWFAQGCPSYIQKYGVEGAKEKGWWMYKRATSDSKAFIDSLEFDEEVRKFIVKKRL